MAACAEPGGPSAADSGGASDDGGDIVFGQLLGITGDYASFSPPAIEAAQIAVDEINEAGGVLGREVTLATEDNRSTVDGAIAGYQKLVSVDGAQVLGSLESDGIVALYDTITEQQLPTICSSCGTTFLDDKGGEYFFRVTASDSDAGLIAAQLARDAGYKNMSMIVQNTEGASGPAEVAEAAFSGIEGNEVNTVTIEPGRSSYAAEVDQALSTNPDVIYVGAGIEAGLPILREIHRRGYDVPIIVSPDLILPETTTVPNADNLVAALGAFDVDSPTYESYAERFQERTGEEPSPGLYDANNYDQYILFALAMQAAGTTDGSEVASKIIDVASAPGTKVYSYAEGLEALENGEEINFEGASSSLDMNENGNLVSPQLSILRIVNGEWAPTESVAIDSSLRPSA
ncbi:ABC transporter substrate-binding protein [Geodermatophilus sp. DF01_2]|uniref:ABC transporter substrate-binding protein n=1 Tax=Geodermatophilus sp. DF01-2 TaxID=2559610 RepID=UPI00142FCA56|nr:ABC transporter substrate-binding protein [Geodermatophilus sp. DF01_2]